MATRKKKTKKRPPWERKNPRPGTKKLSASAKQRAKRRAKKAGRRYPNLVDNLREARQASPRRKPSSKRKSPKKARRKKVTKDPRGGLTAAGRAELRLREGSHLRPTRRAPARALPANQARG